MIEPLLKAMNDLNEDLRKSAAKALGRLGKAEERVIQTLVMSLRDREWTVRQEAIKALEQLGKVEDNLIDQLLKLLREKCTNKEHYASILDSLIGLLRPQNYWNKIQNEIQQFSTATPQFLHHSDHNPIIKRIFFFSDAGTRRVLPRACRHWHSVCLEFREEQFRLRQPTIVRETIDDQTEESTDNSHQPISRFFQH